jgi:hypothetical protein
MARKLVKGIVLDGEEKSYDVYEIETEIMRDADGNIQKDSDGNPVVKAKPRKKGEAVIRDSKGSVGIALVHRVDYGAPLEEKNSGRYAILKPTLERLRGKFEQRANEYFGGKG